MVLLFNVVVPGLIIMN